MRLDPLKDWPVALRRQLLEGETVVRIVVAVVQGSAPREPGVGMLVGGQTVLGTIGGGELEWRAVRAAGEMRDTEAVPALVQRLVLAADLGQCCGGVVELWMERYTPRDLGLIDALIAAVTRGPAVLETTLRGATIERRILAAAADAHLGALLALPRSAAPPRLQTAADGAVQLRERVDESWPPVWLYGAGHVGQAVARLLTELPFDLTWIDSRAGLFSPECAAAAQVVCTPDPAAHVAAAPAGARHLIMTHSHALDFELCQRVLARGDFAWLGLIGSKSKAARFRSRLVRAGFAPALVGRLVCPIGIDGVASKWPAAIGIAVAAQLLQDTGPPAAAAGHPAPANCAAGDCGNCGTATAAGGSGGAC